MNDILHSSISEYVVKQSPEIQKKITHLRQIILASSPKLVEEIKYQTAFYTYKGLFCYFSVEAKSGRLYIGFCDGHLLADPKHVLINENTKQIRRLYADLVDNSFIQTLRELLQEALWVKDQLKSRTLQNNKSKKSRIL